MNAAGDVLLPVMAHVPANFTVQAEGHHRRGSQQDNNPGLLQNTGITTSWGCCGITYLWDTSATFIWQIRFFSLVSRWTWTGPPNLVMTNVISAM